MCFVGIGAPSAACNLARLTHAPGITLIYESGTIATKPNVLPLSIGDGELCETALTTVLGAGDVPLLAAGRPHHRRLPRRRADRPLRQPQHHRGRPLRQAEGAAARRRRRARDRHLLRTRCSSSWRRASARSSTSSISSPRSATATARAAAKRLGVTTKGPTRVITDLCLLEPDAETKELTVAAMHPGVTREQIADGHRLAGQVRRQGRRDARRRPAQELVGAARPACAHQGGASGQGASVRSIDAGPMRGRDAHRTMQGDDACVTAQPRRQGRRVRSSGGIRDAMDDVYSRAGDAADPPSLSPDYRQHARARAEAAADHHSADAVGDHRPGLRPLRRAAGGGRPHHAARRRAARRAHHRHGPRARRGRPPGAQHAGRDLAVQRRRPLHPRGRPAPRAARSQLHRRRPLRHRRQTAPTGSSPSSPAPIPGATTPTPGARRTSTSRCSARRS